MKFKGLFSRNNLNKNTMIKVFEIKDDISKYNQDFNQKYYELSDLMTNKFNDLMGEIQNLTENLKYFF